MTNRYLICPCVQKGEPNACMDPGCLSANKCLDLEYGGQDMRDLAAASGVVPEHNNPTYVGASGDHICPYDKFICSLTSCAGGSNCYAKRRSNTTTTPTSAYTTSASYKECHIGMNSIGVVGNAELFLGRESAAKNWDLETDGPIGMIIGLLGDAYPQGPVVGANAAANDYKGMEELLYDHPPIPNIWIKWPDYGIVAFKKAWWLKLLNIIKEVNGPVLIYCMGGHGRTGTAAAILATLGGLVPEGECPVTWLRSVYCEKVVESKEQLKYVETITGRKVVASEAKGYGAWVQPASSAGSNVAAGSALVPLAGDDEKKNGYPHHLGSKTYGGSGSGKNKRGEPQRLSIKKWKVWWRRQNQVEEYPDIAGVTRPKDLPNGKVFRIGKRNWQWNKDEHVFVEVKEKPK